jgi:hypothetical protein
LSTDFALIWDEKIVQKARFLINGKKGRIAGWFTLTPTPPPNHANAAVGVCPIVVVAAWFASRADLGAWGARSVHGALLPDDENIPGGRVPSSKHNYRSLLWKGHYYRS